MPKIVLTGGGTAGHVTPNLALLPGLKSHGFTVDYIGTADGLERGLIEREKDITYHIISAGKFRRYLDLKNITDPFKVLKGIAQSRKLLKEIQPDVVFSKGGFVAVPVVFAAHMLGIPTVIHESDISCGLATRLSIPKANKVCLTFSEAAKNVDASKAVVTGSPMRAELFCGNAENARKKLKLDEKPVILFMGGSSGARVINQTLRKCLSSILEKYNVLHICGAGNLAEDLLKVKGYVQKEYVTKELADYMALASAVVSRAGSNSINEFLALHKPMLLIPLSREVSRGDQEDNAESFKKAGYADVLLQQDMTPETLCQGIDRLYAKREAYIRTMKNAPAANGTQRVLDVIFQQVRAGAQRKK